MYLVFTLTALLARVVERNFTKKPPDISKIHPKPEFFVTFFLKRKSNLNQGMFKNWTILFVNIKTKTNNLFSEVFVRKKNVQSNILEFHLFFSLFGEV